MKWLALFSQFIGRTKIFGIDLGFWVGMAAVLLLVCIMNLIVWSRKPKAE